MAVQTAAVRVLPGHERFRRGLWISPDSLDPHLAIPDDLVKRAGAGNAQAAFELGGRWLRRGRFDRAVPWLERAALGPLTGPAAALLGAAHAELGHFDQAAHWFPRALTERGLEARRGFGILFDFTGGLGSGDKYTRWAADGGDGPAAAHLGATLVLRGRDGDGVELLEHAAAQLGDPAAMFRYALCLVARGEYEIAARWCERAADARHPAALRCAQAFLVRSGAWTTEQAHRVRRAEGGDHEPLARALDRRWGVRRARRSDHYLAEAARTNLDGALAAHVLSAPNCLA